MIDDAQDFPGLFCQAQLPVEWLPVADTRLLPATVEQANQNCLKIILGLDEVGQDTADDAPDAGHELQRLEFKLNVILELVAQLALQSSPTSESTTIKMASEALQWSMNTPPLPDQCLQIKLHLDPRYPLPVTLSGRVLTVEPQSGQQRVTVKLIFTDEHTQELWEKYIFRCHRRHIARIKSLKTS